MKGGGLRAKLRGTIAGLFLAVMLVWALFFLFSSRQLAEQAEQNATLTAGQVINALNEEFLLLERISFTLSQSAELRGFLTEADPIAFHERAAGITGMLDARFTYPSFLHNLLVYRDADVYYRFWGKLGNTAARTVYFAANEAPQPRHLAVLLEGMPYIGYATAVYDENGQMGSIVLLIEEGRLQAIFDEFQEFDDLQISLAAGGEVIASTGEAAGLQSAQLREEASVAVSRQVGFTPFEIIVSAKRDYLVQALGAFALTGALTALLFVLLFVVFTRMLTRHFFTPMLDIMQGVERIGSGSGRLPAYSERDFDSLAGGINTMLDRLDERNEALLQTRLQLQQTEIERQQAVILALKKQISAHFTVNVLASIKLLAGRGEMEKAGEVCDGLSFLLRYSNAGDSFINGLEEFFILQKYVDIMQIRYAGRIAVSFDADDQLGDIEIPRMLIQPLIENAIQHGQQGERRVNIHVRASLQGEALTIEVEDDGCGIPPEALAALREALATELPGGVAGEGGEHVALANIQRRVRSYYGEDSGLHLESRPGQGTRVTLTMQGVFEVSPG